MRRTASAETSLRTAPPRFPWPWAIPALLFALGTALVGVLVYPSLPDRVATHIGSSGPDRFAETTVSSAFGIVAVQILLTVLLLGLVAATLRSTHELSPAAPRTSAEQHRRFLSSMARSVLLLVTGLNITMLVVALMLWDVIAPTAAWQVASIAPSLLAAVGVVVVAIRAGQSGHRLAADVEEESAGPPRAHPDDDANWIGGLLYVNRDDPALLVPKRFGGVGWTVNLARPAAWLVIAVLLAAGIGLPVWAASGAA